MGATSPYARPRGTSAQSILDGDPLCDRVGGADADGRAQRWSRVRSVTSDLPKRNRSLIAIAAVGIVVGGGVLYLAATTVYGAMSYRSEVAEVRAQSARAEAEQTASAAETYRSRLGECPTIGEDLVRAELLEEAPMDPWGRNLAIDCAADHITVVSPGPDGSFGTEDDVIARR